MSWIGRVVTTAAFAVTSVASLSPAAHAQVGVSAEAQGEADIESGANQPSNIEMQAGSSRSESADDVSPVSSGGGGGGGDDGVRLAIQGRFDAINTLALSDPGIDTPGPGPGLGAFEGRRLLVPIVTPGVRLLDEHALFLGLGFGFAGISTDSGGGDEDSRSGWSLSPLVSYDIVTDENAALALLGWFNFASLGETEDCNAGGCMDQNDDAFGWGVNLGAQLRGHITPGVSLGGEFGWGFLDISFDPGLDAFVHGVFGNIFIEGSIGL